MRKDQTIHFSRVYDLGAYECFKLMHMYIRVSYGTVNPVYVMPDNKTHCGLSCNVLYSVDSLDAEEFIRSGSSARRLLTPVSWLLLRRKRR